MQIRENLKRTMRENTFLKTRIDGKRSEAMENNQITTKADNNRIATNFWCNLNIGSAAKVLILFNQI